MQPRDPKEEELRLKNSSQLMYGNKDANKVFPFDTRMRFKWVVYHEVLGVTEDGQTFSKVSTRRFSFFSPQQWDDHIAPKGEKSWFEKNKRNFVILHNPIEQAELEGHKIKGYHFDQTGLSLHEKLRLAASAQDVASQKGETIEDTKAAPKRGRKKEEVTNG